MGKLRGSFLMEEGSSSRLAEFLPGRRFQRCWEFVWLRLSCNLLCRERVEPLKGAFGRHLCCFKSE